MAEDVPSNAVTKASRPANNDANHSLQPRAVTSLKQDNETASTTNSEHNEDNPCIQSYAVASYQEHDGTVVESANCDVIQPCAVKYQKGEDTVAVLANVDDDPSMQPSAERHQGDEGASPGNVRCDVIQPHAVKCQENGGSCSNDLHTTRGSASKSRHTAPDDEDIQPYAVAYVDQDDVACRASSGGTQMASNRDKDVSANPFVNNGPNVPNQMNVPNVQQPRARSCDGKQERISFGGYGEEPGKFRDNFGVAVSADNEIFVTDQLNKRVQVFSIKGTFLRLFPTVVPGESMTMYPLSVALDVEPGYLWVLGRWRLRSNDGHVVQYSKNGQPIKKFDVSLKGFFPVIAMDVRNNKVIVGDQTTIMMFDPNGSRLWSSEVRTGYGIFGVTSDKEGNVLLTDGRKTIQKYNPSGVKIFEFGTYGQGKGQLNSPRGICLDTSGHIIVASYLKDRVDMFTSQGEFVRTIADIKFPEAVAMGPCGELVVTSPYTNTVSIFPRHMVLP
ncbi:PREDICTED: uncharacterized protein LOC109483875 [Branchiostoma belcheri]|uniref:Uncharacterized protein LOC109483875 n=1 Tax=Branchiostoma belcheri TaxID=7741 RepID=A0A6P5AKM5_BRABE|nr:PREDICTED: uncharacterized protein LOC109483875 [Branchiostoma belcheri]